MKPQKSNWQKAKEVGDKLFNVRLPGDLAKRLDAYATERNTTRTEAVRIATREYLDRVRA